ncbi:Aspartyl-tRNA(Asn) amidotransferase subunit A @ Glutamyl-tRNA(Gln) amidotransferase subunit A, partial [hydrothermal vent metagenome]
MTEIFELGIADIRSGLSGGDFTAKEVAETFIERVSAAKELNAFLVETPDHALAAAQAADKAIADGKELGKMAGVPIGMKDLFCTQGVTTTA